MELWERHPAAPTTYPTRGQHDRRGSELRIEHGKARRFQEQGFAYILVAPQIIITMVFFHLAGLPRRSASRCCRNIGTSSAFVWFNNFKDLFTSAEYLHSFHVTLVFSFSVWPCP